MCIGDRQMMHSTLKFGSREAAIEVVRKLTKVGAVTHPLHDCIAYQTHLDLDLDIILTQPSDLDKASLSFTSLPMFSIA